MTGIPVVVSTNGIGIPVKPVESGAPVMTVAENGYGAPVVISTLGAPFVFDPSLGPQGWQTATVNMVTEEDGVVAYDADNPATSISRSLLINGNTLSVTFAYAVNDLSFINTSGGSVESIRGWDLVINGQRARVVHAYFNLVYFDPWFVPDPVAGVTIDYKHGNYPTLFGPCVIKVGVETVHRGFDRSYYGELLEDPLAGHPLIAVYVTDGQTTTEFTFDGNCIEELTDTIMIQRGITYQKVSGPTFNSGFNTTVVSYELCEMPANSRYGAFYIQKA